MPREFFKLDGTDDLERVFAELGPEIATKVGQRATNRAAKAGADHVRERAPVSEIAEGAVRKRKSKKGSTAYAHHKIKNEIKVRKGRARTENVVVSLITTGRAFHAGMVEKGTKHAPAHPFMLPALDASASEMASKIADELVKGTAAAVKRIARIRKQG